MQMMLCFDKLADLNHSTQQAAAARLSPGVARQPCRILPRIPSTVGACGSMPFRTKRPCLPVSRALASSAMLNSRSNAVSVLACICTCKMLHFRQSLECYKSASAAHGASKQGLRVQGHNLLCNSTHDLDVDHSANAAHWQCSGSTQGLHNVCGNSKLTSRLCCPHDATNPC